MSNFENWLSHLARRLPCAGSILGSAGWTGRAAGQNHNNDRTIAEPQRHLNWPALEAPAARLHRYEDMRRREARPAGLPIRSAGAVGAWAGGVDPVYSKVHRRGNWN